MDTSLATKVYASSTVINQHGRVIYKDQSGKLVGIEVGVFSYKVPESQFDNIIEDVCGGNFRFQILKDGKKQILALNLKLKQEQHQVEKKIHIGKMEIYLG